MVNFLSGISTCYHEITPSQTFSRYWDFFHRENCLFSSLLELLVVYHVPKVSWKSAWKVNENGFSGLSSVNFLEQRNIWNADGMFQAEILVPFVIIKTHLWYQLQAFAAVFHDRYNELICANGILDSGKKFTSPEYFLPFAQTANRPVCLWIGKQPLILTMGRETNCFPTRIQRGQHNTVMSLLDYWFSTQWKWDENEANIFSLWPMIILSWK